MGALKKERSIILFSSDERVCPCGGGGTSKDEASSAIVPPGRSPHTTLLTRFPGKKTFLTCCLRYSPIHPGGGGERY